MATPLHRTVDQAAQGPHVAAMSADALSTEIGALVEAHAAEIAEGHGLNFVATPASDISPAR